MSREFFSFVGAPEQKSAVVDVVKSPLTQVFISPEPPAGPAPKEGDLPEPPGQPPADGERVRLED